MVLVGPPTLMPPEMPYKAEISCSLDEVVGDCDVIYLLRLQLERQQEGLIPTLEEYAHIFQMNGARLARAKKDVIVMHPGPIIRGVEISAEWPTTLVPSSLTR